MFRLVTNFDHWHSIYESADCSDAFKVAPFGVTGPGSFPSVTLATSPQGLGERQFVVILVVESLADLWSLEAVFRLRVGDEIRNIFSADNAERRKAVMTLKEVAESVDRKIQAHRRDPGGDRKSATIRLAGVALAGFAAGVGILVLVGGYLQFDSDLAKKLLAEIGQGVQASQEAASQSTSVLQDMQEIRDAFRNELTTAVATAKTQMNNAVNSAAGPKGTLGATLKGLKEDLAKDADGYVGRAAQYEARAKEYSSQTRQHLDEVRALIEGLKKLAKSSPTFAGGVPIPGDVATPEVNPPEPVEGKRVGTATNPSDVPASVAGGALKEEKDGNNKLTMEDRHKRRLVQVQRYLQHEGYNPGPPDGKLGTLTKTAFLSWSKKNEVCEHLDFDSSLEDYVACADVHMPKVKVEVPSAQ